MTRNPASTRSRARAFALAVVLPMAACGRFDVEGYRARAAVKEYNAILPRAYTARRAALLEPCTTPNERERVGTLISALEGNGRVLDSRQEEMRFASVRIDRPPVLADVETDETWWYRHLDAKAASVVQAPKRVGYRLRYKLVRKNDRWLVDRLELLSSTELPVPG